MDPNEDLLFEITLYSFQRNIEDMTEAERLEYASSQKEKGVAQFKLKNFRQAKAEFLLGLGALEDMEDDRLEEEDSD